MTQPLAFIIEDDPEQTRFFQKTFEAAGYAVTCASDGEQAMAYLQNAVPHLILLDLHLPDMKGSELLVQIKADERLSQTTVIIASADATFASYMWERADFVLSKPVSYQQLRQLLLRLRP